MKNVFLVDDDETFNFINSKLIQQTEIPINIHTALNGAEAISLVNDYFQHTLSLPDVILLDINMPVMDGFSFIEAFLRLPLPEINNVKIVIVSSSDNPKDLDHARDLGIRFLNKPVNKAELLEVLC